jgi:Leucine-rich repeat (LRR) protein
MYLDLSYTAIDSIQSLTTCSVLTSLSLAGNSALVSPQAFSPLSELFSLQLLSLRSTLFTDSTVLEHLCKLRSLDFGHCSKLSDISPLAACTRLEELVLDSSGVRASKPNLEVSFSFTVLLRRTGRPLYTLSRFLPATSNLRSFPMNYGE